MAETATTASEMELKSDLEGDQEELATDSASCDEQKAEYKEQEINNLTREELLEQLKELETKLEAKEVALQQQQEMATSEKDRALRAHAELENFKKRKEQEAIEFRKYANENFIMELLPMLDSFDRAVEHIPDDHKEDEMIKGFVMIQKQFHTMLEKAGVEKIEAINQQFDPNFHQAVGQEQTEEVEADIVLKEYQAGYKLNNRVIRPSMVIVSAK